MSFFDSEEKNELEKENNHIKEIVSENNFILVSFKLCKGYQNAF